MTQEEIVPVEGAEQKKTRGCRPKIPEQIPQPRLKAGRRNALSNSEGAARSPGMRQENVSELGKDVKMDEELGRRREHQGGVISLKLEHQNTRNV